MAKAIFLGDSQLRHLFKVAAVRGDNPVRDTALILTMYGTGMKLTEAATLPVRAYLKPNGDVLVDSEIPPEVAYNGKARPICWTNAKVKEAIDAYLALRSKLGLGVSTKAGVYRGLDPNLPLFLTESGTPFRLVPRRTGRGAITYSCDAIGDTIKTLHQQAGIEGATAESARRTFAVRLHQKGFDLRHINELLGHETLKATKNLIDQDPVKLGSIVAGVI